MGCLAEFFMEFVCEVIFEVLFEGYVSLMTMIVPDKDVNIKASTKKKIKNTVTTIAVISFISIVIGFISWVQEDIAALRPVGKYMTLIPLVIILVNITLGIIAKIISKNKKS